MIYTRFGSEVKIEKAENDKLDIRRIEDGKLFLGVLISDLKADNGMEEIEKAIKLATPTNLTEIGF